MARLAGVIAFRSAVAAPKSTPVVVEIAGQRLRLAAHGDPESLHRLAALVNARVEVVHRAARGSGAPTVLALVALDLAEELVATRRRAEEAEARARGAAEEADGRVQEVEARARAAVADAITELDRLVDEEPPPGA